MNEKINAAFILFDQNNSGTMSFDELAALIKTVFGLIKHMLKVSNERGMDYPGEFFPNIDFDQVAIDTTKKAFSDLQVPMTMEINYQQFVQWTTGQNMYTDEELEAIQRTQPPSKSAFAKKKFASSTEWAKRFPQEEEFVDHLMKIRDDC